MIDEIPLDSVYPVPGLVSGDKGTISIPATWSSNVPGPHIVRAIIDSDSQILETDELRTYYEDMEIRNRGGGGHVRPVIAGG